MACEQGIFPRKGNGPDRPLDGVIIELDPSIVEEADEAFPVVEGVPNGLGRVEASGQLGQHLLEPRQHICDDRSGFSLAHRQPVFGAGASDTSLRSEEHTSELQSLMRISYAVFCLKKKIHKNRHYNNT